VAVFTKTIHSTRKQDIHLTKTAQYIAPIFTVQNKYMNIHSTIQYIYVSTIQVHEHYKTQETEITEGNTENAEENKMNILPGN
jgi:hypothetical protein